MLKRLGTGKGIQTVLKIDMTIVVHAPRPDPPTRAEHVGQEADAVAFRLALSVRTVVHWSVPNLFAFL